MRALQRWVTMGGLGLLLAACSSMDPARAPLDPADTVAMARVYQQGRLAYQEQRYEEAAQLFARLVAANPNDLSAHINWGAALSRSGKPLEAIPHFQQVLLQDPSNAEAYFNWGAALARLGKHEEALDKFDQALRLKRPEEMGAPNDLQRRLENYLSRQRPETKQPASIKSPKSNDEEPKTSPAPLEEKTGTLPPLPPSSDSAGSRKSYR